jgi:hypothetical protein
VPSSSCTSRVIPLHTAVRSPLVRSRARPQAVQLPLTGSSRNGGARIWLSASEEAVYRPGCSVGSDIGAPASNLAIFAGDTGRARRLAWLL